MKWRKIFVGSEAGGSLIEVIVAMGLLVSIAIPMGNYLFERVWVVHPNSPATNDYGPELNQLRSAGVKGPPNAAIQEYYVESCPLTVETPGSPCVGIWAIERHVMATDGLAMPAPSRSRHSPEPLTISLKGRPLVPSCTTFLLL